MPFWVQTEQPAVYNVRQPSQRVPVGGISAGESPFYAFEVQAALDTLIFGYVIIVIVADKLVESQRLKGNKRG